MRVMCCCVSATKSDQPLGSATGPFDDNDDDDDDDEEEEDDDEEEVEDAVGVDTASLEPPEMPPLLALLPPPLPPLPTPSLPSPSASATNCRTMRREAS
jgi:hypothetical protein